jgi:hypothetical protein
MQHHIPEDSSVFTAMETLRDQQFEGILEQSIKNLGRWSNKIVKVTVQGRLKFVLEISYC